MTKFKVINLIHNLILWLLFIFFICEHHVKFTAIKNISLYTALLLALILLLLDSRKIFLNMKTNFKSAKFPLVFLIIFISYAFFISLFPYHDGFNSFGESFSEFGRGISFLLVILIYANRDEKRIRYFFYSILWAFLLITVYYAIPFFENIDKISSNNIKAGRLTNRAYATFVDRFMIFPLAALVLLKDKYVKIFITVFCLLAVFMCIFTGARGSWLAMVITFMLFGMFLFFTSYIDFLKKHIKEIFFLGIIFFCSIWIVFLNSPMVIYKISQGTYSSGRNLILKERLPLLFESNRAFWGLGHGFKLYDKFLEDKSSEKNIKLSMTNITKTGRKHWFNDEPFFIGNYYYYGFIGTLALALAYFSMLFATFRLFRKTRDLFFATIFVSLISYFGIRGLFETMNIRILYLFYMIGFFILVSSKYNKKDNL